MQKICYMQEEKEIIDVKEPSTFPDMPIVRYQQMILTSFTMEVKTTSEITQ